jgi:ribosomal protein L37E
MKIPDLLEIAVAWKRAANPTEEQQTIAESRITICNGCEHKEFRPIIRAFVCDACGCPLSKKVYSPKPGVEACPKSKWTI